MLIDVIVCSAEEAGPIVLLVLKFVTLHTRTVRAFVAKLATLDASETRLAYWRLSDDVFAVGGETVYPCCVRWSSGDCICCGGGGLFTSVKAACINWLHRVTFQRGVLAAFMGFCFAFGLVAFDGFGQLVLPEIRSTGITDDFFGQSWWAGVQFDIPCL